MAKDFASGIDGRGVVQVEVAVVECGWTSCSCVKKVFGAPRRVADCLQADVADDSFVFCKYVHVSFLVAFQWRDNMPHRCNVALVKTRTGGLHSVIESLCHFGVCVVCSLTRAKVVYSWVVSGGSGNGGVLLRGVRSDQGGRFLLAVAERQQQRWCVSGRCKTSIRLGRFAVRWWQCGFRRRWCVCLAVAGVLTEFVGLSVASYIDGRGGSGGGCSCGVCLDFVQLRQESSEDDDGIGSPREGC